MNESRIYHLLLAALLCCSVHAALAAATTAPASLSNTEFFDPQRVLKVEITMDPADWEKLRKQQRDGNRQFSKDWATQPQAKAYKPFSWFKGAVMVDGFKVSSVGIRKRGFFGSADDDRPGLNIDFDKFIAGQEFAGAGRMTLSNNKEDSSLVHQALA